MAEVEAPVDTVEGDGVQGGQDSIVERFKSRTDLTVDEFVKGHFYEPQDADIIKAQFEAAQAEIALAKDKENKQLQEDQIMGSTGMAIIVAIGFFVALSIFSIIVV